MFKSPETTGYIIRTHKKKKIQEYTARRQHLKWICMTNLREDIKRMTDQIEDQTKSGKRTFKRKIRHKDVQSEKPNSS